MLTPTRATLALLVRHYPGFPHASQPCLYISGPTRALFRQMELSTISTLRAVLSKGSIPSWPAQLNFAPPICANSYCKFSSSNFPLMQRGCNNDILTLSVIFGRLSSPLLEFLNKLTATPAKT
ncbi:hypothetical protein Zmor_011146 [Zophobas morio]|uniref:Uncharacterized protein n=1 Tax=Zophobas morio TaxID=2755281 RepID=A0AA38IT46_9CUCU|nr:hypothetical protein Zmor_011146 [Zophobas morio]